MIDVKDAKKFIQVGTKQLSGIILPLKEVYGYATADDIYAPIDFPEWEQAAMDGYGIFLEENIIPDVFSLDGVAQTGDVKPANKLQKDAAIRIFTGAKIPDGVNTVIQQEWVQKEGNNIRIIGGPLSKGMNIRKRGSQTKKGQLVLTKGSAVNAAATGLLAGLGISHAAVLQKPRIIIINTGKELVPPGQAILSGQVYESNSFALHHILMQMHIQPAEIIWVDDEEAALADLIRKALLSCDLLLVTGGVSVGDYDFVIPAMQTNGVEQLFHKVKQKPGKPLYAGKKDQTLVFGLPGNPASVLTCFYQYVYPCIRAMSGFLQKDLPTLTLPALNNFEKKAGLTHFLKGKISGQGVQILSDQESYKMNTYAVADVLIEIDAETTMIKINDPVKVYLLPFS
ncbi:MAG: molybdopterin molybdotransferase MoeA [Chitinophagaceae bacterium]|nr:molybdopterin molybdotransferase MoeA [Chitinophagaceae bacterium]